MNWPDVMYADVFNYLILTSNLTSDQLKEYKSLDGYNHFANGWVTNVTVTEINISKAFPTIIFATT